MENKKKITPIAELGEFGLIKHITDGIKPKNESTIFGIGDDAALLDYTDKQILITTDLLTEGIHFDLTYVPLKHLGYKAAVVNFSDIFAMNGIPRQITVSIAISAKFSVEAIEQLYEGIKLACEVYNVDLIGGDTSSSLTGMTINITAIGEVEKNKVVYRNGAKQGNLICVSGNLGSAYAGLQLLEREKHVFGTDSILKTELEKYPYILERQLKPEARKDVIEFFKEKNILPTSMIDISDGLSSELLHICEASDTGCKVYENKIPIHEETINFAKEINIDPTVCAMNGGEDYELLFTIDSADYNKVIDNKLITIIGSVTDKISGTNLISDCGAVVPLSAQGWNSLN